MIVGIDTEFERRKTFKPILSIIQIKIEDKEPVIYDVINKKKEDLLELMEILSNDNIVKVIHSAKQDLEAIFYHFDISMKNIFDTQIANKYLFGENEIGYLNLVKRYCDKDIIKEKRLQHSNWLRRPLSEEQIFYAKQDVFYLKEIYKKMIDMFDKNKNKKDKFIKENKEIENEDNYIFNPIRYWDKIKNRFKKSEKYVLYKKLFILREKIAFSHNLPREFVIKKDNLIKYIETKDTSFLKTHYKVNKNRFLI